MKNDMAQGSGGDSSASRGTERPGGGDAAPRCVNLQKTSKRCIGLYAEFDSRGTKRPGEEDAKASNASGIAEDEKEVKKMRKESKTEVSANYVYGIKLVLDALLKAKIVADNPQWTEWKGQLYTHLHKFCLLAKKMNECNDKFSRGSVLLSMLATYDSAWSEKDREQFVEEVAGETTAWVLWYNRAGWDIQIDPEAPDEWYLVKDGIRQRTEERMRIKGFPLNEEILASMNLEPRERAAEASRESYEDRFHRELCSAEDSDDGMLRQPDDTAPDPLPVARRFAHVWK